MTPADAIPEPEVRAAGGVILRDHDGTTEILLVHRPKYDDWTIPKGKLEPGESDEDAARREVEEETGYRCRLGAPLPGVDYLDRHGRQKHVSYWRMQVFDQGIWEPNEEIDARRWIALHEADTLLSYETDRGLLETLRGDA